MSPEAEGLTPPVPPVAQTGVNSTRFCLMIGMVLGIVTAFGGWVQLVVVVVFGFVGLVVGRVLDGKLDPSALLGRPSSR